MCLSLNQVVNIYFATQHVQSAEQLSLFFCFVISPSQGWLNSHKPRRKFFLCLSAKNKTKVFLKENSSQFIQVKKKKNWPAKKAIGRYCFSSSFG